MKLFDALYNKEVDLDLSKCVGKGWVPIIEDALNELISIGWDKRFFQIKQKLGGLRIYLEKYNPYYEEIIERAALKCSETCEYCGKFGKLVTIHDGGYLCVLCEDCEKREMSIDKN